MKVLIIGGATQDTFLECVETRVATLNTASKVQQFLLLPEAAKVEVGNIVYYSGGGATNSAVSFKRLGFASTPYCLLGNDCAGQHILQEMANEQVDSALMHTTPVHPTGMSYIIPSPTGERTILAFRGANSFLLEHPVKQLNFSEYNLLYITSLTGDSSKLLPLFAAKAKNQGLLVANNPGGGQLSAGVSALIAALEWIDIFILNYSEAQALMQALKGASYPLAEFDLTSFFKTISSHGPSTVVVTNGSQGVNVYHKSHTYFQPAVTLKPVCTVGAGDAFGSCFVAQLARGDTIENAMLYGVLNSASVISHIGAKKGLLTQGELEKRASQRAV